VILDQFGNVARVRRPGSPRPIATAQGYAERSAEALARYERTGKGRGPNEGIRASDKNRNCALVPLGYRCDGS
jgi:hypothetical protein